MKRNKEIREATVDSIFYPGKKEDLEKTVRGYLEAADYTGDGAAEVILVPHAGYDNTGNLMAAAYKSADKRGIERVVILSRVHREPEKAVFLPSYSSYATPLGNLPVDKSFVRNLLDFDPAFREDDIPHVEEHSIEVQLPFIKTLWPDASIVPVLTGKPLGSLSKLLADAVKSSLGDSAGNTLFVVSSNLSAYDHGKDAITDSERFLKLLDEGKWTEFPKLLETRKINACSADCLTSMYLLFDGKLRFSILGKNYGNTGDLSGKRVCFGAISFNLN